MTNRKNTKRALITSGLALFICVVMLMGTTFAWFTSTASTSVNKIQAGKLEVDLEMRENGEWVSAKGRTLDFVKAEGYEKEDILWEPGCTYELPELRIVNNGNLALKYKVIITGINGDAQLNEVIDWTGLPTDSTLDANKKGDAFIISGTMKRTAGNAYQGLSIEGISITVYATQDTVEYDSKDNQYDTDATYPPVANVTALADKGISVKVNNTSATPYTLDTAYIFTATDKWYADFYEKHNYGKYHADFVVSVDKDIPANSVMLAGFYEAFCTDGNWIGLQSPDPVKAGQQIRLLQSFMGDETTFSYSDVCLLAKEFRCGAKALDDSIKGTTLTVELRLYEVKEGESKLNPISAETGDYIVIGSYSYTF